MILGMVWRLIGRLPVTAASIVCGLVASISGIWLRRRQILPAPEIPGSVDLIPGSAKKIPGSAKKFPVICLREFADKRLFFMSFSFRIEACRAKIAKIPGYFRFYGNLADRGRAADRPS